MAISSKKFYWSGIKHGLTTKGYLHANNISEAKNILKNQHIKIRYLYQERKNIHLKKQVLFFKQLSTLLIANISIIRSLEIIKNTLTDKVLQDKTSEYIEKLQQGDTISSIFSDLDHFNLQLLIIGEKTGRIEQAFEKISTSIHQKWQTKKDIIKTLTYPFILLFISSLLMIGLLIWVVPQFEAIFLEFHAELPFITQAFILVANLFAHHLIFISNSLLLLIFICSQLRKNIAINQFIEKNSFKIPIISTLKLHYYSFQFFLSISLLIESGISISDALSIIKKSTQSNFFKTILHTILLNLRQGNTLSQSVKNTNFFSDISTQMIHIAEESGRLDFIFNYLGIYHQQQFQDGFLLLKQLLEPSVMLLMALLVGLLLFSLYLPIFKLGSIF